MDEAIEAIVTDETKPGVCKDCGARLMLWRIRVTAPARCAGILLWTTPAHGPNGSQCPARTKREVPRG